MSYIVVITFVLFFVGIILCLVKEKLFKKIRYKPLKSVLRFLTTEKYNEYLTQIIITILGVTIAIVFTNVDVKNQERDQTIDFLDVVHTELSTKSAFVDSMLQDLQNENNVDAICSTIKITPISPALSLEVLLSDSPYTSTISGECYSALLSGRMNFTMQQARIENEDDTGKMMLDLLLFINELERSCQVIEIELEYQNGHINKDEVYEKIDVIMNEPVVIDVTKYGATVN